MAAIVAPAPRPVRCQDPPMAASDDPVAAPVPEPRGRIGTALGIAITVVAIVLAVSFGVERGDDEARVAKEVVELHELPPEGPVPPAPGTPADGRFAANAAAAGWVPIGTREDRLEGRDIHTTYWQKAGSLVAQTTVSGARWPYRRAASRPGGGACCCAASTRTAAPRWRGPRTATRW